MPLPVLPATWNRTSGLFVVMKTAPYFLPPTGSLNAALEKSLVTKAVLTTMLGLTDCAPST